MIVDPLARLADEIESQADISSKPRQLADLKRIAAELRSENQRIHSWAGLMSLLDEHYPSDAFDGSSGDPGPRIIVLIRECDALRHLVHELKCSDAR
jgi:hypothetical protein